jgi:hypothetical protein
LNSDFGSSDKDAGQSGRKAGPTGAVECRHAQVPANRHDRVEPDGLFAAACLVGAKLLFVTKLTFQYQATTAFQLSRFEANWRVGIGTISAVHGKCGVNQLKYGWAMNRWKMSYGVFLPIKGCV